MLINRLKSRIFYIVLIVGLSSGVFVHDAAAAGTPKEVKVVSGNQQTGVVGTKLSKPFVVLVKDSGGNAVPNAEVVWTIKAGGGHFTSGTTVTNSSGEASNLMTLGTVTEWNQATVYSAKAGVTIGANATSGPASTIGDYSGNAQTGIVGSTLPKQLKVICKDKYGNLAGPSQIDWTVSSGGGSVPYFESPVVGGIAVKSMTLGTVPGVDVIKAQIDGTSTSYTFTETAVAAPPATMTITSGNAQEGEPGVPLPSPFKVLVADKYGNPLSGTQVNWAPMTTGDTLAQQSNSTATYGHSDNTLTMGQAYGKHRVTATVSGTNITQTLVATHGFAVTMQDNPTANAKAMEPYFLGLSYPKTWMSVDLFDPNNATTIALFKNLGPGVLRFLGEEASGAVPYSPNGRGLIYGTVSNADLTRVAAFLKAANWKVLYGIGLYGNTSASAASEAAAASKAFGSSLLGFEIGNEPDIYYAPHYGDPPAPQIPDYTWQDYISPTTLDADGKPVPSWVVFANAIRAKVPDAPLTGPTGGYNWAIDFTENSEASKLSLLTMHYYAEWSTEVPKPTANNLLAADPRLAVWLPGLDQAAKAANIPGGYRITECNSVSINPVPGVTNGFGAALWTIDFLFANALYQSSGVNFTSEGSYSPLADNEHTVTKIGPDYYGLFAYSLLDKGGRLLSTQVSPGWVGTFSAYAVEQPDGSTDAILSNKDPDNSITVAISPQSSLSKATSLLLTAPSLTSTSGFTLGGSAIKIDGSWTPASNLDLPLVANQAVVTVPPGSAQLIHME